MGQVYFKTNRNLEEDQVVDRGLQDKDDVPGDPGGEGDDLVELEGKGDGAKGLDNKRNTLVEPAGKDVTKGTGFGKPMRPLGSSLAQSLAGWRKDVESDAEDLGGSGEDGEDGDDGKDLEGVGGDGELL